MINPTNFPKIYKRLLPRLTKSFKNFVIRGHYIGGPLVAEFENQVEKFLNVRHAIGCKSGTHALQLALIAAGIGYKDEVITVANTYYATAYAIKSVGAKPIFCDVLLDSGLIDPALVVKLITKRTKAVLPVHLYGYPADLKALRKLCKEKKLTLIEDCAHAFGTKYQGDYIGRNSDFACFSFYPTKNLGALGDAGMITTKSKKYADKIRRHLYLANLDRTNFPPRAIHARLDPVQAGFLKELLGYFPMAAKHRQLIAEIYFKKLSHYAKIIKPANGDDVVHYVFPLLTNKREKLIKYLSKKNIYLQIHYDINLHCLPQFKGDDIRRLPSTEKHNKEVVSLSVHPSISMRDAIVIADHIIDFFKRRK